MARLLSKYREEILPALREEFGYRNILEVPRLEKIVVNVGLGEGSRTPELLDAAAAELAAITGQRPVITRARKSIANFRLRQGMPVGCRVTLRGARMYEFLDRLVNASLPRIRDFRGVSPKAFDGRGNYTLGLKEQILFPEIEYDKVSNVHGMDVCIVSTAKTDEEARALLRHFGMPFRN
jgi:large subunit ribosomal protein L5